MLQSWVSNKVRIMSQKRGSFRSRRTNTLAKEPKMESQLNAEFEKARSIGRKVSYKWVLRHARKIYSELHPQRVIQQEGYKKMYLGFQFSSGWFRGFKRRYNISLRASTKRAQKSPNELLSVIQNWLQFNRRMMVVRVDSDCGIQRDLSVLVVSRFKLSEISNID
jgi:Tc5 transposase DNA-binding domain